MFAHDRIHIHARSALLPVFFILSLAAGRTALAQIGPQSSVLVTPNHLVFAPLTVQTSSSQSITVTNTGTANLIFTREQIPITSQYNPFSVLFVPGSCGYPPNDSIAPGASCTLQVYFYPFSLGLASAAVVLTDNAPNSPQSIPLSGSAVPLPNLLLQTIDSFFSSKVLTPSAPQIVLLNNLTAGPADNLTFTVTGANPNDFLVSSQCPSSLAQYLSCPVSVVFFPQMMGTRTATLTIASSQAPITVPLSGTGALSGAFEIVNSRSGKALNPGNNSTSAGAPIQQNALSGRPPQQWSFVPTDGSFYKVVNSLSGRVLDVTAESTADGALIQQYDYLGGANQQWQLVAVDDVHYKIVNRLSGKVLDLSGGSPADGTAIQQWDYLGDPQQLWVILPGLSYNIANVLSSNLLDIAGGSSASGTPIQQSSPNAATQQQWQLLPVGAGYYAILNLLTGKVLDVTGESTTDGAPIQQWDYLAGANQQWRLVPVLLLDALANPASPYQYFPAEIVNRLSGKALDDTGSSTSSGTGVQQWDYLGNSNQQWRINPLTSYVITSAYSGLALDVPGGSTANGTSIQQWARNGFLQQQWQLLPVAGYFAIINNLTGKALEVSGSSNSDGALIDQSSLTAADNQLWQLTGSFGDYIITNKGSGKVLDETGFSMSNGTLLQQWDRLFAGNQLWNLTPVN